MNHYHPLNEPLLSTTRPDNSGGASPGVPQGFTAGPPAWQVPQTGRWLLPRNHGDPVMGTALHSREQPLVMVTAVVNGLIMVNNGLIMVFTVLIVNNFD